MKNKLKRAIGVGLAVGAMTTGSAALAATATTTVEVSLPTVLVLYHYDTIQVGISQSALSTFLAGPGLTTCAGDACSSLADKDISATQLINDLSAASPDAGMLPADTLLGGSTVATVTVQNAVGVRAIGCATYDADFAQSGTASDAGVTITAGAVSGIDGQPCSLGLTTGDLSFDLDFDVIDATATQVDAVFDLTIVGT